MTILEQKVEDYMERFNCMPTKLYIGSEQKWALQKKLGRAGINGQMYQGMEIVLIARQTYFEVG